MMRRLSPALVVIAATAFTPAAGASSLSFPETKVGVPPLSLRESSQQIPPLGFEPKTGTTFRDIAARLTSPRKKYISQMPVLVPGDGVDPKMPVKAPHPAIDYKMIVKEPHVELGNVITNLRNSSSR